MKVHRVVLSIVDLDGIGADSVGDELMNARYGNRCIAPSVVSIAVVSIETREVDWSDDHPLNKSSTHSAEFHRLFANSQQERP